MIVIPHTALSSDALLGVIDTFVLREGTDYGHADISLEQKRARVQKLLETGKAHICYYPEEEHIEIEMVDTNRSR